MKTNTRPCHTWSFESSCSEQIWRRCWTLRTLPVPKEKLSCYTQLPWHIFVWKHTVPNHYLTMQHKAWLSGTGGNIRITSWNYNYNEIYLFKLHFCKLPSSCFLKKWLTFKKINIKKTKYSPAYAQTSTIIVAMDFSGSATTSNATRVASTASCLPEDKRNQIKKLKEQN